MSAKSIGAGRFTRLSAASSKGGISTPAAQTVVLLFTGESGHQYGYHDGPQEAGTFWYTGEGQRGDMRMVAGNAVIQDAAADGKLIHLFQSAQRAHARYLGEVVYLGHHTASAPDRDGKLRAVIVFELGWERLPQKGQASELKAGSGEEETGGARGRSLAELRRSAMEAPPAGSSVAERRAIARKRSLAIKVYVRKRANGQCEACNAPAQPAGSLNNVFVNDS